MGASSYRLLDAADFTTVEGFLQPDGFFKYFAQWWWVLGGISALPHEPAQTTKAGKTQTETKPKTRKTYAN
jgi:hypothetical protein